MTRNRVMERLCRHLMFMASQRANQPCELLAARGEFIQPLKVPFGRRQSSITFHYPNAVDLLHADEIHPSLGDGGRGIVAVA